MRRKNEQALNLEELATKLEGELIQAEDFSGTQVNGLATVADAGASDLSFITAEKYVPAAEDSLAAVYLVCGDLRVPNRTCIVVPDVWKAVLAAFDIWYPDEKPQAAIHPSAVVHPSAQIGEGVSIGPLVVIEQGARIGDDVQIGAHTFIGRDAQVGDETLLHPRVTISERVQVGAVCILHSGVVLGADGFKFEVIDELPHKIPQVGTVIIGDGVEIGANCAIDRGFLGDTTIGIGCKFDNMVHIAHNCKIGPFNGFAAQVGMAGSVTTGQGCIFWGQSAIRDQLNIGDRVVLNAQTGLVVDAPSGTEYLGSPAVPTREAARQLSAVKRLPDLLKRVRRLERQVSEK